jgi:hypothetical protein
MPCGGVASGAGGATTTLSVATHVALGRWLPVMARVLLEESHKSGELSMSVCDIKSPLGPQHSTLSMRHTGLSSCGASEEESGPRRLVASANTPPDEAAGPRHVVDNKAFFTDCVWGSFHAYSLLWYILTTADPGTMCMTQLDPKKISPFGENL